ncbi:MAG TPA: lysophospholipid acyltransferase family protein [Holophagaceae bacterium]|nr:lysophospholipid acyltransferase family protein [Holophagaceae bacterium]
MPRPLKVLASAIGFSSVGLGGLLFSLLGVPLLWLLPGGRPALRRRTRTVFFFYFRGLVRFLSAAGIYDLTLDLPPRKELDGTLILATHPGYLDVVMILGSIEQVTCIVKPGVWKNPGFGWAVRAAGYIPTLSPEGVIEEGSKALQRGETLILFPEGTRTEPGQPYQFQRGAAHLALRSEAPVLAVAVSCEPPLLAKGHRWYQMPKESCDYRIRAFARLGPFSPGGLSPSQAARDLTERLEQRFDQDIHGSGHQPAGDQAFHRHDA